MNPTTLVLLLEAIRELQAEQTAQHRLLRAFIASHPNRDRLRDAWHRYAAPSIATADLSKVLDPDRRAVHEAEQRALSAWSAYLAADPSDDASRPG